MAQNTGWNCSSFCLWLKNRVSVCQFFFLCSEPMSIRTLVSVKEWFVVGMHNWFCYQLQQWESSYPLLMKLQPMHRTDHMKPTGFYYLIITTSTQCDAGEQILLLLLKHPTDAPGQSHAVQRAKRVVAFVGNFLQFPKKTGRVLEGFREEGKICKHSKSYWSYITSSIFTYCILTFPSLTSA